MRVTGLHRANGVAGARPISPRLVTMKTRREFLAAARSRRAARNSLVLQGRRRTDATDTEIRVGYTASRKVGNAVLRNRAKRRMRAAAAAVLPAAGRPGWDYVLIARHGSTAHCEYSGLVKDLETALRSVHGSHGRRSGRRAGR